MRASSERRDSERASSMRQRLVDVRSSRVLVTFGGAAARLREVEVALMHADRA